MSDVTRTPSDPAAEGQTFSGFDPEQPVLVHRSHRPAIPLHPNPSREELALDWTLSETDLQLALQHRGRENLCRFAVQLCLVRRHGRFLTHYQHVPATVLGYLCQQLEIETVVTLAARARDNTESDYQREIVRYLKLKPFDDDGEALLRSWILSVVPKRMFAAGVGRGGELIPEAERFLRSRRIVIPPPTTFERAVNTAYRGAEHEVFRRISEQVPAETKRAIDRLLQDAEQGRMSSFLRFGTYPPEARARHIMVRLTMYEGLAALGLERMRLPGLSVDLVERLARATRTYSAWQISRFDADKRYALAACFLHEAKKTALDDLVEMHARFMTNMQRLARNQWEAAHRALRKRVKRGVTTLRRFGEAALASALDPEARLGSLFDQVGADALAEAVEDCRAFERLQSRGYLGRLHAKYPNFRRYFRSFVELEFACEPGSEPILEAVERLRRLNSGEERALPSDVDTSFVPSAWRSAMQADEPWVRRRTWEIALALALKDRLRSGDVFLPESCQHVSFWTLCYGESAWETKRESAYDELGLPEAPREATRTLVREFVRTADRTGSGLGTNPFVEIVEGRLHTKRDKKLPELEEATRLRELVRRKLSRIRIEELLVEVDQRCRFTDRLIPPDASQDLELSGGDRRGRGYTALHAAIVALGTNLGIATMADSTEELSMDMLLRASTTCLREETLKAANTTLVDYHRSLETSLYWGDGSRASSDGQRFGVRERTLLTALYPRYFGYYDRAVSVYTHTSGQFSVFSTEVISCYEREAPYVLDGLLQNDTGLPVRLHHTDTHGYTDQVFGLCYLLGFSFMPRIKKLKQVRLYKPAGRAGEGLFGVPLDPRIDSLFRHTVDLDLIEEQWDSLVRVAASLKNRIVPASLIAKRFAASGSSNRLARALTDLGRFVKTTYLLRFVDDEELRLQVRRQLNRGEGRHNLARYVFFADQGEFRKGDYQQIMNQASCLSLISNAILIHNTLCIGEVLEEASRSGPPFSAEAVARISPLVHRHVVVNGSYDFTGAARRAGRG